MHQEKWFATFRASVVWLNLAFDDHVDINALYADLDDKRFGGGRCHFGIHRKGIAAATQKI